MWVDVPSIQITSGTDGLRVTGPGLDIQGLLARRTFPSRGAASPVALIGPDGTTRLMLESMEGLPPDSYQVLENALPRATALPLVREVLFLQQVPGHLEWTVRTADSEITFLTYPHPSRSVVSRDPDGEVILECSRGDRYRIPAAAQLDAESRWRVELGL
jgi:hypothetical protein